MILVKPATVVQWHRKGFRHHWCPAITPAGTTEDRHRNPRFDPPYECNSSTACRGYAGLGQFPSFLLLQFFDLTGSETLSRSRSLVGYTIDMHESEFSEATSTQSAPIVGGLHHHYCRI